MDRTSTNRIDESALTKGQLRKLNALRKSVGDRIGERAFAEWLALQPATGERPDRNAAAIVEALWPLVEQGRLLIPRGGYVVRRGRGRIIVEPSEAGDHSPPPEEDVETVSPSSPPEPSSSAAGGPGAVEASVPDIAMGDAPAAEAPGERESHT